MDTGYTLAPKLSHARVVFEPFAVDSIRAAGVRLLRDSIAKSLPSKGTSGL